MDEDYKKKIDKMHAVLFGDEESKTKGMVEKVSAIYDLFVKINNGVSLIGWVVGAVIVLGLLVGTVKGWFLALLHILIKT